jgi:hypothetical protein
MDGLAPLSNIGYFGQSLNQKRGQADVKKTKQAPEEALNKAQQPAPRRPRL